jgi:hypothetical protein
MLENDVIAMRWTRGEAFPRPLRFLSRRIVQAMAERATPNMILGERVVPGRFLVLRLAADGDDRSEQEATLSDSRSAIEGEVLREARAREFRIRGALAIETRVLVPQELESDETRDLLRGGVDEEEMAPTLARLREEREVILPRRLHRLEIDSRPQGAAIYLDDRQLEQVTPCRLDDLPGGRHRVTLSLPGYLLHEGELVVEVEAAEGRRGARQQYLVELEPEPPMGVLELVTFPAQACATVNGETRETPTRFRLPAGPLQIEITRPEYEPRALVHELPPGPEGSPSRLQVRLDYAGEDRDVPVGRLLIYKPDPALRTRLAADRPPPALVRPMERPEETIATFFGDQIADAGAESPAAPELLGERPITRGVLVIGRPDPNATLAPDVKLFDPLNTVSRGCHAWLHVYTDPGTGAEFNTFVIHNNSPGGIQVDGRLVMDSVALGDESEIQIGIFRMRIRKETPEARVEF